MILATITDLSFYGLIVSEPMYQVISVLGKMSGKSRKRQAYDNAFKIMVIEFAEKESNLAAERKFSINEKLVRDWRKNKAIIVQGPKHQQRIVVKPRPYKALENDLSDWLDIRRQNGQAVSKNAIRIKALLLMGDNDYGIDSSVFKASNGWCTSFLKQCGLSINKRKLVAKTVSPKIDEKAKPDPAVKNNDKRRDTNEDVKRTNVKKTKKQKSKPCKRKVKTEERPTWNSEETVPYLSVDTIADDKTQLDLSIDTVADDKTQLDLSVDTIADDKTQLDLSVNTIADDKTQLDLSVNTIADDKTQLDLSVNTIADDKTQLDLSVYPIADDKTQLDLSVDPIADDKTQLDLSVDTIADDKTQLDLSVYPIADNKTQLDLSVNTVADEAGKEMTSKTKQKSATNKEKRLYKCSECDYKTYQIKRYKDHIGKGHKVVADSEIPELNHKKLRVLQCNECDKSFMFLSTLNRHKKNVHPANKFICNICGKMYKVKYVYNQHMATHSEGYIREMFKCQVCDKEFTLKATLTNHTYLQHSDLRKMYSCPLCGKTFYKLCSYMLHANIHAGIKRTKEYICEICGKEFFYENSLKSHRYLHDSECRFSCEVCGKAYRQKMVLRNHMKVHKNTKDHICRYCGQGFTQKQALTRHERIHTGDRPFVCKLCSKTFNDYSIVRRHLLMSHKIDKDSWRDHFRKEEAELPKHNISSGRGFKSRERSEDIGKCDQAVVLPPVISCVGADNQHSD